MNFLVEVPMKSHLSISPVPSAAAAEISKDNVAKFQTASLGRACWQVINSFVPYVLLWVAMVWTLAISFWLMLPLAILAAGFLARIFIIFHDCGTRLSLIRSVPTMRWASSREY
jgi:fatty acid desaturase